jgi:hypothetical protein
MEQVMANKVIREFKIDDKAYVLVEPSAKVVRDSRLKYSIKLTEAIKHGLIVKRTLEKQLRLTDHDFFTEYNEHKVELLDKVASTEHLLSQASEPEQLELLARTLMLYRAQLLEEDKIMNSLYEGTADQAAEDERVAYLAYSMVRNKSDNSLTYPTYEEFLDAVNIVTYEQLKYQVICWEYKLDPDWHEKLPEAKALLEAQKLRDVQDSKIEADKQEEKVQQEKEATKIEAKEKPVKKRGKKPRAIKNG